MRGLALAPIAAALLALGSARCAEERSIPLPASAETARAIVLAVERAGEPVELIAYSGLGRGGAYPLITGRTPDALTVQLYQEPLERLGLREGRLLTAEPGQLAHPLPFGESVYAARGLPSHAAGWAALGEPPRVMLDVWLPGTAPVTEACPTIEVRRATLPLEPEEDGSGVKGEWITVQVALADGTVLLGSEEGRFFRVRTSTVEKLSFREPLPHGAGVLLGDGRVAVGSCEGQQLAIVNPETLESSVPETCSFVSWVEDTSVLVRLVGPPGPRVEDLIGLTRGDNLVRYGPDGRPTTHLVLQRLNFFHYLTWLANDDLALSTNDEHFLRFRGGELDEIRPEWSAPTDSRAVHRVRRVERGIAATVHSAGTGAVLVTSDLDAGAWRVLAQIVGGQIRDVRSTGKDEIAVAGRLGLIGWFSPSTGLCLADAAREDLVELGFYELLVMSPDLLLAVAVKEPMGRPESVVWVERKR